MSHRKHRQGEIKEKAPVGKGLSSTESTNGEGMQTGAAEAAKFGVEVEEPGETAGMGLEETDQGLKNCNKVDCFANPCS